MFRELGHPAAFVYEALEHAKGPQRSFDLTATTGLSRTAVYEALETLAAWHLVEPVDGRWKLVPGTSLELSAEQFGCLEQVRTQVGRHRSERAAYRRALRIVDQHPAATLGPVDEAEVAYLWPTRTAPGGRGNLDGPAAPRTRRLPDQRMSRSVARGGRCADRATTLCWERVCIPAHSVSRPGELGPL